MKRHKARRVPPQLTGPIARTTRDVRRALARLGGMRFWLFDTAGYETEEEVEREIRYGSNWLGMSEAMVDRTARAIREADAVLYMLDRDGVTGADVEVSDWLRSLGSPKRILCFNKCENGNSPSDSDLEYAKDRLLGKDDYPHVISMSSKHGDGLPDLVEALRSFGKESLPTPEETGEDDEVRIAFVGRPNVGKSTLLNRLVGSPVALAAPTPGVTRDPVQARMEYDGRRIALVDTAGVRGGSASSFGRMRSSETMRPYELGALRLTEREVTANADVVVLLIDSTERMRTDDWRLARRCVEDSGGAFIVAATKADACEHSSEEIEEGIAQTLKNVIKGVIVRACSAIQATEDTHPHRVIADALRAHDVNSTKRVKTSVLNEFLNDWLATPIGKPYDKLKRIRFMAQTRVDPPTFTIFGRNISKTLDEKCFDSIREALRTSLGFFGARIVLVCKDNDTPYLNYQRKRALNKIISQPRGNEAGKLTKAKRHRMKQLRYSEISKQKTLTRVDRAERKVTGILARGRSRAVLPQLRHRQ